MRLHAFALKKQICLALISVFLFSGCIPTAKRVPNLDAIFSKTKVQTGKRPLIIIPGILGSELVNKDTGEKVWLNFSEVKGDGLSLPISPDLSKNRDNLIPKQILKTVKVSRFLPEITIYQTLIDAVERYGGYTEGDWENPDVAKGESDKYYVFAYDWRLDNVENARLLMQKIEKLKQKFGNSEMRFNVVAHSMGGLIARYALGSEVAVTSPSVFQLLPHKNAARFYDENLQPIDVNLYDAETWKKYGWSAYTRKSFRDKFPDLDEYFQIALSRAKLFHDALNAETIVPPTLAFFAFGSDCDNTQDGAILRRNSKTNLWQTIFAPKSYKTSDGKQITKSQTKAAISALRAVPFLPKTTKTSDFSAEIFQSPPFFPAKSTTVCRITKLHKIIF